MWSIDWAVVWLHAAPRAQLFVSTDNISYTRRRCGIISSCQSAATSLPRLHGAAGHESRDPCNQRRSRCADYGHPGAMLDEPAFILLLFEKKSVFAGKKW